MDMSISNTTPVELNYRAPRLRLYTLNIYKIGYSSKGSIEMKNM